jgi:hypothetical protein
MESRGRGAVTITLHGCKSRGKSEGTLALSCIRAGRCDWRLRHGNGAITRALWRSSFSGRWGYVGMIAPCRSLNMLASVSWAAVSQGYQ